MDDLEKMADQVFTLLRGYVDKQIGALRTQLEKQIEALPPGRAGIDGKAGLDGKSVGIEDVAPMLRDLVDKAVAAIPKPADGKDGTDGKDGASPDPIVIRALVVEEVTKQVDSLPPAQPGAAGKDGRDGVDGKSPDPVDIAKRVLDLMPAPKDGKDGRDGVSPDPEQIAKAVLAQIPTPKDGRDGVSPDVAEIVPKVLALIPAPKDGVDGKHGRDGIDGKSFSIDDAKTLLDSMAARWQLEFERRATDTMQAAIASIPLPRDGRDGTNGKDGTHGVDFDSFDVELQEDGRTVDFILRGGDVEVRKSVCFPVMLDADVFKDGTEYRQGDCVTYGGQLFVARRSTTGTPLRSPDWRLAVKKGRDAREAREVA